MKNKKEILLSSLPNLLFSVLIIILVLAFGIGFKILLPIIIGFVVLTYCYKTLVKKESPFKFGRLFISIVKSSLMLGLVYAYLYYTKGWGVLSVVLLVFGFSAYLLIKKKSYLMTGIKDIETQIWGKPLDRREWKGESLPKLKFKFKKNKGDDKE